MSEILLNVTRTYFNRVQKNADHPIRGRTSAFSDYQIVLYSSVTSMLENASRSPHTARLILAEMPEMKELFTNWHQLRENLHFIYSNDPNAPFLHKTISTVLEADAEPQSSLHCRIAGKFSETEQLLNCVLSYLHQLHQVSSESTLFRISLVLREVIANAILHGNQSDCSKSVELSIEVHHRTNRLAMEVRDEGNECDFGTIYRVREPDKDYSSDRHGVDLIRHFSSDVRIEDNRLRVEFEL